MSGSTWYQKAIIYELYVDKFAGNFSGLTKKLDYFVNLGINTLWLLPHYPSPLIDGGYDISDYRNIRSDLGTLNDFDHFINEAHRRNLKVIIDMVLNHTSDQHPWFLEAKTSKDNPKRNWYLWNDNQDRFNQAFVHFPELKVNAKNWIFNPDTNDHYYATFYPQQPDLNWDNPEVIYAMQENIDFWLSRGVDGFRLDAVSRLVKRDGTSCFGLPQTHSLLKQIRAHIDLHYSDTFLMAETGGWPDEANKFFGQGDECQSVIHFPLAANLLSSIITKNQDPIHDLWTWSGSIPENCRWSVFLTNHDTVDVFFLNNENQRRDLIHQGNPGGIFSQKSSQSFAGRLAEICQGNPEDILRATELLLTQPGIPIMYYGNEIGMRNAVLPAVPADSREYVRGAFDWTESNRQEADPNSLLNSIRALIKKRQNS